ncbi:hypothetical protein [Vagococcus carniphilus]|uniref:Uncharacterized protein n=1 Tax=Vagococcus carniphilus TaxID=218144 RepID=A0A430ARV2_9ENTE|nr:hypothetical protein [Vagococcus carniphilus]QNN73278.1 hypothetical protein H9L18_01380 [Vagococcus carniphilus]RSU10784.1 hypothetical protein CBF28_12855 [Vagococcus carniphilus]
MSEKIKSKSLDAVATFIGSILALFFSDKVMTNILAFFSALKLSVKTQEKLSAFIFALFVAIGYVLVLVIFNLLSKIVTYFFRPMIKVSFINEKGRLITSLDITSDEPEYVNIKINSKFNRLQLWIICKLLRAKLVILVNPRMCSIELADGYIATDDVYSMDKSNGTIYCDIFTMYSPSKKYNPIDIELNILRTLKADAEFKIKLDITGCKLSRLIFLEDYCKFKIEEFKIEGTR